MHRAGRFIIFEGIDGTGKSTQLQMLAHYLEQQGFPVISTYEPTHGLIGKKIRDLYVNRGDVTKEEELQLFIDDRKEHVKDLINPALEEGKIILCDRYYLSTVAYQGAAGLNPQDILAKHGFAPIPDLALLFELPPEKSIERITKSRGDSLNDFEQKESLLKVKDIFDTLDMPFINRINANETMDEVHKAVIAAVEPHLEHYQPPST